MENPSMKNFSLQENTMISHVREVAHVNLCVCACACTCNGTHFREQYDEAYDVYAKQTLHSLQNMMFPFILRISFASLNQSTDYCRDVPINKRKF